MGTARLSVALAALWSPTLLAQVPELSARVDPPNAAARVIPVATAARVSAAPAIDGRLDDEAWLTATIIDHFTQRDPLEGAQASENTQVRFVYDDEALYVGARLSDSGSVTTRLGRRDMPTGSSDWFRVSFDTYRDRRFGVRFDVNPAGVRRDATLGTAGGGGGGGNAPFGGSDGDLAWDAVWDAATNVDPDGWTAELRIPFNQLRFTEADDQVWGLQIERIIDQKQEHTLFSFTLKSEPGGVPAFGDLNGLQTIRPGRPLELVPYLQSKGEMLADGGNALKDGRDLTANTGVDARYRLTPSLILSATVNPDFGQVEVDPAIINLTAFETRFDERRPFFVEGADNFKFGGNVNGPGANAAALLYSRRVGRPPQLGISANETDVPGATGILTALKLSGKTANGWSVGVLNALTNEEHGRFIDLNGTSERALVEPRANYFTTRINRELREGMSTVGGMVTAVNRDVSETVASNALRSSAYSGGIDFTHDWANRNWGVGGFFVGSQSSGSRNAMALTQRASSRYYQRPDSRTLSFNPDATSMGGWAGTVQLKKQSGLHWLGDIWVAGVSPGFEINDAGFLQRADRVATGGALRYVERQPNSWLRSWGVSAIQNHTLNFDGDWIEKVVRLNATMTFLNYWEVELGTGYERERLDDRLTRGGPLASKPPSWTARAGVSSDPRMPVIASVDLDLAGDDVGNRNRRISSTVSFLTSPRWNLSFGPQFTRLNQDAQYVTAVTDPLMTATFGRRYIFAPLDQTELSLVTRVNYTFAPDLTLEVYLQPLVSNGEYGVPTEFQQPSAYDFAVYGSEIGSIEKQDDHYLVDPDGDGPASPFQVADRSFTTRSLRANAVLRWEYHPGSTLFFVWQQERLNDAFVEDFGVGRGLSRLFDSRANTVFVLKWTYRFNP